MLQSATTKIQTAASIGYYTQNQKYMSTPRLIRGTTSQGSCQLSNGWVIVRSHPSLLASSLPIMRAQEATNPTYLLAWIPESLLDEKGRTEWDKFVSVEGKAPYDEEEGQSDRVSLGTALISLNGIRCCPHRHANFAS